MTGPGCQAPGCFFLAFFGAGGVEKSAQAPLVKGGLGRAATWGRPYKNFGPLSSVGADVLIGPRRVQEAAPYKCVFP